MNKERTDWDKRIGLPNGIDLDKDKTMNKKQLTLFYRAGQTVECPHCKGRGGKTELLYYWIACYLCLGHKKFKIEKIVQEDEKFGDVKAEISFPFVANPPKNKITWLI